MVGDLEPRTLRPLHYFGGDLISFRGRIGSGGGHGRLLPPPRGNLGVGGTVVGDEVRCPWHAWQWRQDGTNSLIPYSRGGLQEGVRIRTYPAIEGTGCAPRRSRPGRSFLFACVPTRHPARDPRPRPARSSVSSFCSAHGYYPRTRIRAEVNRVKGHPRRWIVENAADPYHAGAPRRPPGADHQRLRAARVPPPRHGDVNYGGGGTRRGSPPTARSTARSSTTPTGWASASSASPRRSSPRCRSPVTRRSTRSTRTTSS